MIKIAPSILSADFSALAQQIQMVEKAGADLLHIDVMDGAFVPNITIGPLVIKSIRDKSNLFFDCHLMIEEPIRYIDEFVNAGADGITVHIEATKDIKKTVEHIKSRGVKVGVSLKPETSVDVIKDILDDIDLILIMTVNPGFGGQKFILEMLDKIKEVKALIKDRNIDLEVDGGISEANIYEVSKAGANVIVAGSAIYKSQSPADSIKNMKEKAFK